MAKLTVRGDEGHTEQCRARIHALLKDPLDKTLMRDWLLALVDDLVEDAERVVHLEFSGQGLHEKTIESVQQMLRNQLRFSTLPAWIDGILNGTVYPVPFPSEAAANEAKRFYLRTAAFARLLSRMSK